jgi:alpha-1,6-mannosyltransferase
MSRELHPVPLSWFFGILATPIAAWAATWCHLRKRTAGSGVVLACIAAALVFRVAGFFAFPLYEDDFYRYLWDGYVFAAHGSPYGVPPSVFFGKDDVPAVMGDVLSQVNYPDIPTIYGPVCELVFLLSYKLAPGELWPLKLLLIAADIGMAGVLWKTTRSTAAVVLYAWAPLVVKEVAFTAHPDVLAAVLAVLAVSQARADRRIRAAGLLGAAIAAKVLAVVLIPFAITRRDWRAALALTATVCCFYLPFLLHGTSDVAGFAVFADEWEFNSFAYGALSKLLGTAAAKAISPGLFVVVAGALWHWKRDWFRPDIIVLLVFLFAPVVNPWYLVLLAPFVALNPSAWGVTVLATVFLSYATGMNLGRQEMGQFDHLWWVRPAELVPVLLAAAYDRHRQQSLCN